MTLLRRLHQTEQACSPKHAMRVQHHALHNQTRNEVSLPAIHMQSMSRSVSVCVCDYYILSDDAKYASNETAVQVTGNGAD